MRHILPALLAACCLGTPPAAMALQSGDHVDNFRLEDHRGALHELYGYADATAIVFLIQGNGCPIVRNVMPALKDIQSRYAARGVRFFLINSNLQDQRESITQEVETFEYGLPVLLDQRQRVGEALGFVRTGESFIVDPATWRIVYHGVIDDRVSYEHQKPEARSRPLVAALDDLLAGRPVATPSTRAIGCLINFPARRAQAAQP